MHQSGDRLSKVGEDKRSECELCPSAFTDLLHTGCHGDNFFFLSDILCGTFHDFRHEHEC